MTVTSSLAQVGHDVEQDVDLVVGQRRGRLVHDEDADVLEQHPADLDQLLLADRQVADQRVRVEVLPEPGRAPARALRAGRRRRRTGRRRRSSRPANMFSAMDRFGKRLSSWWMMPMPRPMASRGLPSVTGSPSSRSCPDGRLLRAGQDLHQRRLAGAVLADQHVDLAAVGGERDVLERPHAAVGSWSHQPHAG